MADLSIRYLGHSGFLVNTARHYLLFDLYRDDAGVLSEGLPKGEDGAVFVSHSHGDHFNPSVFRLGVPGKTAFITDIGVKMRQSGCKAHSVAPYDSVDLGWCQVRTFGSTDEGCSFLVEADGWSIFHAGDLNDWYWRDESTPEELENGERRFLEELDRIKGNRIDVAFFPVDQRLGRDSNRGAMHFARMIKPGYIIPMHTNGRLDPVPLMRQMEAEGMLTEIVHFTKQGDNVVLRK